MRTTRILSVSLPPAMLEEAERIAKEENRTKSELVREALRRYMQDRAWLSVRDYGAGTAKRLKVKERDTERLVQEYRQEKKRR